MTRPLIGDCTVAMMQKDEGDVLRAWIDHYTSLFVPGALTIFDNGSSDPETLAQLERARHLGIAVERSTSATESFLAKGEVLLAHFRKLIGQRRFFYPCDCDELLVCGDPARESPSLIDCLDAEFQAMRGSPATIFRIAREYRNAPGRTEFSLQSCFKVIFKDRLPLNLDRGFHLYDFPHGKDAVEGIAPSALAQVHFHNKPFDLALRAARLKLKGQVPHFERKAMRVYKGPGEHLRPLFNMKTEHYEARMSEGADIDLANWFERRGIRPPHNGPDALRTNDDERVVFERRPLNPATHYRSSGLGEASIDLLEPLLWRAGSYIEYIQHGTGAGLARDAGVTETLTIRATGWRWAERSERPASGIDQRSIPLLPLRRHVERYAAVPERFRSAGALLVAGPYRFAVLCTLYAQMDHSFRVCCPEFRGWRRQREADRLFETVRVLDGVAVLAPKPGLQALAAALFSRYWRDAT